MGTGGSGYVSPNRNLMTVLSYLWILAVVPLVAEKEDREVQWHAKHGLVLLVAEIAISILISVLGGMLSFADAGCSGCMASSLFWVVALVVRVLAIVKGLNGQRLIIPGLSDFANKF
jgi:uncharacterized membrane protein